MTPQTREDIKRAREAIARHFEGADDAIRCYDTLYHRPFVMQGEFYRWRREPRTDDARQMVEDIQAAHAALLVTARTETIVMRQLTYALAQQAREQRLQTALLQNHVRLKVESAASEALFNALFGLGYREAT